MTSAPPYFELAQLTPQTIAAIPIFEIITALRWAFVNKMELAERRVNQVQTQRYD